jgi:hypothetical protein
VNDKNHSTREVPPEWGAYFATAKTAVDYEGLSVDSAKALAAQRVVSQIRVIDVTKPATITDDFQRQRLNLLVKDNHVIRAFMA